MSNLLSKGWFKALVLALPATFLLGPIAMFGAFMGVGGIYYQIIGEGLPNETVLNSSYWRYVFRGGGAVLGLAGLWLMFLFENRIKEKRGLLNYIVTILLISGVVAGVLLLYDKIYLWEEYHRLGLIDFYYFLFDFPILMLVVIGTYYVVICLKPNKRLQLDAAPPRD